VLNSPAEKRSNDGSQQQQEPFARQRGAMTVPSSSKSRSHGSARVCQLLADTSRDSDSSSGEDDVMKSIVGLINQ